MGNLEHVSETLNRAAASTRDQKVITTASDACISCRDTGWIRVDEHWRPCPCQIERRINLTLPERYRSAKLQDSPKEILDRVLCWLLSPTDGLRLFGPVGTGKTYCAAGIVRHVAEQERPVKFRGFSRVYRDIRECYSTNQSEREVLRELFHAPFLVLDDLGAGGLSDFERRSTLDILDERIDHLRPTVVTTNWTISEIQERMDDRIASRLASFTAIEFTGRDRRLKPKVAKHS